MENVIEHLTLSLVATKTDFWNTSVFRSILWLLIGSGDCTRSWMFLERRVRFDTNVDNTEKYGVQFSNYIIAILPLLSWSPYSICEVLAYCLTLGYYNDIPHSFEFIINPLTLELNPSAQRCLTRFFTGDFASWTVNFVNICMKNQQMQQLFIQFINDVWYLYTFRH
jgi:hypothetical protein